MPPRSATLSLHSIRRFNVPSDVPLDRWGQGDIAALHSALRKMKLTIDATEVTRRQIGATTVAAIKAFQSRHGLPATEGVAPETVIALRSELEHTYYATSKTRTAALHAWLTRLGHPIADEEMKRRAFGPSTQEAVKAYQRQSAQPEDRRVTEDLVDRLRADALKARYTTKTQVGKLQRTLLRSGRIAKLQIVIDRAELKSRTLGPTTRKAIETFQKKYALPETGELDVASVERLESVAASRVPTMTRLKVPAAEQLTRVRRVVRVNSTRQDVADLQRALAFLGHDIDRAEFDAKTFGKTTRRAVIAVQRLHALPVTGHAEAATLALINAQIDTVNPQPEHAIYPHRVRGSVRNDVWQGQGNVKIQVWQKDLRGPGKLLAERRTRSNGFFDVPYSPSANPVNGHIKAPLHLEIKFLGANDVELGTKVLFNPTLVA